MTRPKMFAIFFAIALGLSWALVGLFPAAWSTVGPAQRALSILYQMPVLFAALVVQGPVLKQPVLEPLGLRFRPNAWWAVAWMTPVVMLAVAVAFSALLFDVEPVLDAATYIARKRALVADVAAFDARVAEAPPSNPVWFVVQALPAGVTINLLIALATEVGWRGFLFREVQGGFWRRAWWIGVAEALWLAPPVAAGYLFGETAHIGALLVAVWCIVCAPIWVYLRVRGDSVMAVAVARGTLLALTAVAADLVMGAPAWLRPFYGLSGIAGGVVVLGLLLAHDRWIAARRLMTPLGPPKEERR